MQPKSYLKEIAFKRNDVPGFEEYPFNIAAVRRLDRAIKSFKKPKRPLFSQVRELLYRCNLHGSNRLFGDHRTDAKI